jgi:hypothetical protein
MIYLTNQLVRSTKFQSFVKMDVYIDKIMNMFIYIIENISQYPFKALEDIYCKLPFYASDDIDGEDEKIKKICKSLKTSETFLKEVQRKIQGNNRNLECNFNE